jgi:hypothetical protein
MRATIWWSALVMMAGALAAPDMIVEMVLHDVPFLSERYARDAPDPRRAIEHDRNMLRVGVILVGMLVLITCAIMGLTCRAARNSRSSDEEPIDTIPSAVVNDDRPAPVLNAMPSGPSHLTMSTPEWPHQHAVGDIIYGNNNKSTTTIFAEGRLPDEIVRDFIAKAHALPPRAH